MTNPIGSKSISVGHIIAENGDARVTMDLDPGVSFVVLSPKGSRAVAKQLLDWADHAEEWIGKSPDERARDWIQFRNQLSLDTRTYKVVEKENQEPADARPPEG